MKRVIIVGPGGSGKSTLATILGDRLALPVYHLDQHLWLPGWKMREREDWLQIHGQLVAKPRWIIDGDFLSTFTLRAERADTIIYLNIPKYLFICRWLKRVRKYRGTTRPDMAPGNPESFSWQYLWWLLKYSRNKRLKRLDPYYGKKQIYLLRSSKEVADFLKNLPSQA